MKKICTGCGEERDAEKDFNWKYKGRGIRNTRCKICMAQASKQHYQENKQAYMARIHTRDAKVIENNQRKVATYLAYHPCVDCGQADIRVLEFDHVHGTKAGNISRMIGEGYSWSTHPCVDCGQTDIRCLEFDHVRGEKSEEISRMLQNLPWSVIEAEIAKCEVRCANCHRIKTLERGRWWRFGLVE
jgi:hypothetical protein